MSTSKASRAAPPAAVDWHAKEGEEVLDLVRSQPTGLTPEEVTKRRETYGENRFTEERIPTIFERIFDQIKSPLVMVLVIACVITVALGEFVDGGVIALALLIAVVVGIVQEGKASRAFQKLAESQVHVAYVVRDGRKSEIESSALVPGDIVELKSGMQVPADVRLLWAKHLSINEAPLTGEWQAVDKETEPVNVGAALADQTSMAFMGTFVAEGQGEGVVVATGDHTAVGELAQSVQNVTEEKTPLQREMEKISTIMLYIILTLVAAIFLIGMLQDKSLVDMLFLSIAIAVASVPEGLPAAVTIILAVGMEALLKRGGLVRNLLAAETLGSTTYVLTDKTGTLTEGKMGITGVLITDEAHRERTAWKHNNTIKELFNTALCASDAFTDNEAKVVRGDPVEQAILKEAEALGFGEEENSYRADRLDYLPFTSEQRFAAGLVEEGDAYRLCVNGAPETILRSASRYLENGEVRNIDADTIGRIERAIEKETAQGKRLVAVGYKQVEFDDIPDSGEGVAEGLIFAGVIIFNDPVREGVSEAIKGVLDAGAKILLITGDNPETALSIARTVGIAEEDTQVLSGTELESLSDAEIESLINDKAKVFARVLPKQKLRIAQILQRKGEIVAMTGDGINDAPALRKANIGVAIGSGTEVAKEASDLVLVNDTFATIYAAIEEGRRIISNLRKIVGYLLSTSLSEVVLIGGALITGASSPITAVQILWANIIEEGLMGVAFAFEPGEKGAMKRKPRDIHEEGILSMDMVWFMGFAISILSGLTLVLYFYLKSLDIPFEELRSAMFLSISIDSLFMAFAFRSLSTPFWKIPLRTNMFFVGSFLLSAGLLAVVLSVPTLRGILEYTPLPLSDILLVFSFSLASLMTIEIGKFLFFEKRAEMVK